MRYFRFRILSLLLLTTLLCVGLAWYLQPKQVSAVARFLVRSNQEFIFSPIDVNSQPTDKDVERYRATVLAMALSESVIQAAMTNPKLQKVKALRAAESPIDWIQQRVEVQYEGDSELLEIRMRGPKDSAADLVAIVDSLCEAFKDEIVTKDRLYRIKRRDPLTANFAKIKKEIYDKRQSYSSSLAKAGGDVGESGELAVRRIELEALEKVATDLAVRIETWDIELQAEPRIQQVETAYIEEE